VNRKLTIDLRSVTTSVRADADINAGEPLGAEEENGLPHLKAEGLGLDEVEGNTVDLDETLALLGVGDGGGGFLCEKKKTGVRKRDQRGISNMRLRRQDHYLATVDLNGLGHCCQIQYE